MEYVKYRAGYDHVLALDVNGDAWLLGSGATGSLRLRRSQQVLSRSSRLVGKTLASLIPTVPCTRGARTISDSLVTISMILRFLRMIRMSLRAAQEIAALSFYRNTRATYLSMGKSHSVVTLCDGHVVGFGLDAHAEVTGYMPSPVFYGQYYSSRFRRILSSHHAKHSDFESSIDGDSVSFRTNVECETALSGNVDLNDLRFPELRDLQTGEMIASLRPDGLDGVRNITAQPLCDQPIEVQVTLPLNRPFYVVAGFAPGGDFQAKWNDKDNLKAGQEFAHFWIKSDQGLQLYDLDGIVNSTQSRSWDGRTAR